ncbi:accessory gene regulator B [Ruminiclostridium sufflavum DSM 19573]|uniref:Accessory gene regulator B n=1 Tax=Ruminiclostridium sufflavum DSM 19573 TaxID=1121337 RepID=A0A318XNS9_9FIRM|nr:accessory gene regulator B family protein [Ruminiclostridium sufflavum]PYG88693.1 accessory gene regulator B [Ruminiclostridium sufflavum DSM 19573]
MLSKIVKKITDEIVMNVPGITEEKAEQIDYGLYVAFSDSLKLIAVLITALFLGKFEYTVVAAVVFALNKSYLGGAHAKTQVGCLISYFVFIFSSVYICESVDVLYINIFLFIVSGILAALFAPADLVTKPIISERKKKELKIKGSLLLLLLFLVSFFVPVVYSNIISLITLISTINTTPLVYKLTKNKRGGII